MRPSVFEVGLSFLRSLGFLAEEAMKLRWVLTSVVALAFSGPAWMQGPFVSAQAGTPPENPLLKLRGLVSLCERRDPTSRAACGSFITGFVQGSQATQTAAVVKAVAEGVMRGTVTLTDDAIEAASTKLHDQSNLFCIRSPWTAGHVQALVVQYGREHPDLLEEPSANHMLKILAKAFPCPEGK